MVWVAIGWMVGIAWGAPSFWAALICGAAALVSRLLGRRAISLALGLGLLGGLCAQQAWARARSSAALEALASRRVTIHGYVAAEPTYASTNTRLELAVEAVEHDGSKRPVSGRVLVTVSRYPVRRYGDRLAVTGRLDALPDPDNAYGRYLARRGLSGTMAWVQVTSLPGRVGSWWLRWLYDLKEVTRTSIERILPEPEAGLLNGILLGLGSTLPAEVEDAFRRSGLTHVIVISGFNIGLVFQQTVHLLQRWSSRRLTLFVAVGVIVVYTLFVGPSPPVTRAALMGILLVLAELVGRRPHILTSLATASVCMTAVNPALVWDVSFQLSMVSTLALIAITPLLDDATLTLLGRHLPRGKARAATRLLSAYLLATMAAQLLTFPIIWYHFGEISLVALPANLLALPAQPPITMLGAVAALLGCVWEPLGVAFGWAAYVPLWWTVTIAETFGKVPGAALSLPAPAPGVLVLFYGTIGGVLLLRHLSRVGSRAITWAKKRWGTLTLCAVALLLLLALGTQLTKLPDGKLHVYALDVGQGDSILIRTPRGATVLIDGGPDPLLLKMRLGRVLPMWHRQIDLVVATHADSDHLAGLVSLPRRYRLGGVLQPPDMGGDALAQAWEQQLQEAGVAVATALRGQSLTLDSGITLEVLHPGHELVSQQNRNENSVVLLLTMGDFRMLLTGDIESEAERELSQLGLVAPVTVLKVAHHGSPSSSSEAFLAACQPQIAVISVGAENRVGHPSYAVLERLSMAGARILRTDDLGTVELVTDGQRLWVR